MPLKLPGRRLGVAPLNKYGPPPEPTVKPTATLYKAQTYFTVAGETKLLYTAESWVKARLMLENAGPVAIGESQNITPVLSGRGLLLPTKEWVHFMLNKGSRIYIAAEVINRVRFIIEATPWNEVMQILKGLGGVK